MSMFQAVVRIDDAGMAANVGGAVLTEYKTVTFSSPELAEVLLAAKGTYVQAQVLGVIALTAALSGGEAK